MLKKKTISRREFIKKTSSLGAAIAITGGLGSLARPARAEQRDFILIGHPNPSTGPIASFGEASPWADDLAIEEINKQGGIFVKEAGKKLPLKLKLVDTASDPTKAADVASKLILNDKIDIMVALHTPDTVNPVTSICERYQMPSFLLMHRLSRGWKADPISGHSMPSGQWKKTLFLSIPECGKMYRQTKWLDY